MHRTGSGGGVRLRLFAALPVAGEVGARLADWSEQVEARIPAARRVDPTTLHVTFAYLGDVAEEYLPAVATSMQAAAAEVTGPTLCATTGIELFGGARVLGVDVDVELYMLLSAARDRFVDSLAPWAADVDRRPWHPHVSLLRTGRGAPIEPSLVTSLPAPAPETWIVSELALYASLPGLDGHQHRLLHAVPLGMSVAPR